MANNPNPNTYEHAQRMIEALEQQMSEISEAGHTQDYPDSVLDALKVIYHDLQAQRDALAERAVDLPTDAQFYAQQDALLEEAIRNDPYGGDDFALFNSGDCW
tara:strand:- start:18791 stop:19099 length:309 start_codon:yes stop_codon:yes gene_type:complete